MKKEFLCLDCGCYFVMSVKQIRRLKAKGLYIPTHCPMCRNIRWKEERRKTRRAKKFERKIEK